MKMTRKELDNLVRVSQLKEESPSANEIAGLVRSGLVLLAADIGVGLSSVVSLSTQFRR